MKYTRKHMQSWCEAQHLPNSHMFSPLHPPAIITCRAGGPHMQPTWPCGLVSGGPGHGWLARSGHACQLPRVCRCRETSLLRGEASHIPFDWNFLQDPLLTGFRELSKARPIKSTGRPLTEIQAFHD